MRKEENNYICKFLFNIIYIYIYIYIYIIILVSFKNKNTILFLYHNYFSFSTLFLEFHIFYIIFINKILVGRTILQNLYFQLLK